MLTVFFSRKPNASLQLLPKAGATKERRLEAVSCKALLGLALCGSALLALDVGAPPLAQRETTSFVYSMSLWSLMA